jgi:hypothetical protein
MAPNGLFRSIELSSIHNDKKAYAVRVSGLRLLERLVQGSRTMGTDRSDHQRLVPQPNDAGQT